MQLLQKRYMVSGTRCPCVSLCWHEMVKGVAAPEGPLPYYSMLDNCRVLTLENLIWGPSCLICSLR